MIIQRRAARALRILNVKFSLTIFQDKRTEKTISIKTIYIKVLYIS